MRTKNVNARPNWRYRREEYLRATGRHDELINEGYEASPPSTQWMFFLAGDMLIAKSDLERAGFAL